MTRAIKWCRRQPSIAALIATTFLVPLAVAVGVSIHNAKLNEALAAQTHERERADKALTDQTHERERADANYLEARGPLRMLSRTAEQSATQSLNCELERKQAEDALVFFRAVIDDKAEADPEIRYQLAEAIAHLAVRTEEVGDRAKTIELQKEALVVFDALSYANPAEPRFIRSRAMAHGQMGFSLLNSNPSKAEEELLVSVDLLTALHQEFPKVAEYAHRLGQFTHNLGTLRRRANRLEDAEAYFRKAIAAHEGGMKVEQPTPLRRVMLSDSWIGIGLVAWQTKRYVDAEDAYGHASEQLDKAISEHPGNTDASLSLGTLHINWGLVAQDEEKPELALARFDRAVELLEDLLRREPKLNRLRLPLYNAHGARHAQLASLGKYAAAAADSERQSEFASLDRIASVWGEATRMWAKADKTKECLEAASKTKAVDPAGWPLTWDKWQSDEAFSKIRELEAWKILAPQGDDGKK